MDLYACSASRGRRRPPRSSGRTVGWRGGITRASTRVIASPRRCSGRSRRRIEVLAIVERRREYDRGAARAAPAPSRRRVVVRGVRFLGAGRRAAGGDVLRAVRGRVSGRGARGDDAVARRRHRADAAAVVRGRGARRGSFRCRSRGRSAVATCGGDGRVPRPAVACARRAAGRARGDGRAGTWCSRGRATRATGSGRLDVAGVPAVRRRRASQPRSEVVTLAVPAGRRGRARDCGARARPRRRARRSGR